MTNSRSEPLDGHISVSSSPATPTPIMPTTITNNNNKNNSNNNSNNINNNYKVNDSHNLTSSHSIDIQSNQGTSSCGGNDIWTQLTRSSPNNALPDVDLMHNNNNNNNNNTSNNSSPHSPLQSSSLNIGAGPGDYYINQRNIIDNDIDIELNDTSILSPHYYTIASSAAVNNNNNNNTSHHDVQTEATAPNRTSDPYSIPNHHHHQQQQQQHSLDSNSIYMNTVPKNEETNMYSASSAAHDGAAPIYHKNHIIPALPSSIDNFLAETLSDTSLTATYVSSRFRSCRSTVLHCLHRIFSINVAITVIIILSLVVAVASVLASSLATSHAIVLDMGASHRETLALNSDHNIQEMFHISTRSMELSIQMFGRRWNYLKDIFDVQEVEDSVIDLFRSALEVDQDALQNLIIFDDGSSIIYADFRPFGYVLYTSASKNNYTADVFVYKNNTATVPYLTGKIPNWNAKVNEDNFWQQAMEYKGDPNDYILSNVFTISVGPSNVFCFSKKLFDSNGQQYAVLTSVYNILKLETILKSQLNSSGYILVTTAEGSFVGCTLNYSMPHHTLDRGGDYMPISRTNHTELIEFEHAIMNHYGGWKAIENLTTLRYKSHRRGELLVSKVSISFPNRKWFVYVVWPENEWTDRINQITKVNVGIALGVLLGSVLIALCLSIPVTRSINRIKDCFKQVRRMDLDAPVITKTLKGRYVWYEPAELLSSFRSMLYTLKSFQKYVPSYVVYRLVHEGKEASLGLKPKSCSIMFLDLKDFTKFSEEMDAKVLVDMIGEIFESLSSVIQSQEYQGIIDKYIGDCIMAYWHSAGHEERACRSALACKETMDNLSKSFVERGLPAMECRIGVNSGNVLIGNFGSKSRFNYTLLGDHVNLASRLETLNKSYGTVILISEHTVRKIPHSFITRRVENAQVKGKEQSVLIYELMKQTDELSLDEANLLNTYEHAFDLYIDSQFAEARRILSMIPEEERDSLVRRKIEQCEEFLAGNLYNWSNGILRIESK